MAQHNDIGKKGEQLAQEYLLQNNYTLLETNYHYRKAEIDIIAQKNNVLAIVEVKTRSSLAYGNPESFVNKKKISLLIEAANAYIDKNNLNLEVSLDIITVVLDGKEKIDHLENAYYFF